MAKNALSINTISLAERQQRPEGCQWLHRLINRRSYRISVLIMVCVLNVVDLLVDWYFYISKSIIGKVRSLEHRPYSTFFSIHSQGLVFGPPPANILLAIYSFCIISTLTSLLEVIQIIRDTYQNRLTSRFGQLTNCLTLWLEDAPLLTLNLLLVICNDGEVTYTSLAKAAIGIFAALIRFLSILLNKWLIRHDYERKDRLSKFFNAISTLGVVLVFMISITIHIIASLPIGHDGHVYLGKPSDFQQIKFAQQKYFDQVGVYLRSSNEQDKYIYLIDLKDIIESGPKQFVYSVDQRRDLFCIKQFNQTCFIQANESNLQVYDGAFTNKLINYSIAFQFKEPDFYYSLGDILYSVVRCDLKDFRIDDEKISLHYFRLKLNVNGTTAPILFDQNNQTYRYYDRESDFQSVEYLWKTGLSRCASTSSFSPHRAQEDVMNPCRPEKWDRFCQIWPWMQFFFFPFF